MARKTTRKNKGFAVLPDGFADFLRRRLAELTGMALILCAGATLVALAGFVPGDPSLNSAADGTAANPLGQPGAYVADMALQTLGLAAGVPILTLLVWGWRLARKDWTCRVWPRIPLMLAATLLTSVALSAWMAPGWWPFVTRLGGVTGTALFDGAASFTRGVAPDVGGTALGILTLALAVATLIAAFGLTWSEWRAVAGTLVGVSGNLRRAGDWAGARAGNWGRDTVTVLGERQRAPDKAKTQKKLEPTLRTVPTRAGADLVAPRKPKPKTGSKEKTDNQGTLKLVPGKEYSFPPLHLLEPAPAGSDVTAMSRSALQQNAELLGTVLEDFGVRGEIVKVRPGPVVTMYELEPAPGTKTSRVIGLSDDIARSMSAISVRVAVVPGRNVIGIELPNAKREMVHLRELLASDSFERSSGLLTLALGKDIGGMPVQVDLARMPHMLIAGTTGSGKSVAINTMILSLLYRLTPDQCRMIMIDPKMLELSVYEGIPHLLCPVVTEAGKAVVALKWTVREMEDRYRLMSQMGVRNIAGYNGRLAEARKKGEVLTRRVQTGFDPDTSEPVFEDQALSMDPLPLIVVVVDEMADLMVVAGKDIEAAVQRLAQMARAAGIHLIMATQRPSVDVITGTIKANFPNRVSFQVTSKIDSRTILAEQGAEQLLGRGDMLYMAGGGRITRVHGPFVSDEEVEEVVSFLKTQRAPDYVEEVTEESDEANAMAPGASGPRDSGDALYDEAVALVAREEKASTSFIQRHLQIGYNRAARIIERMEQEGVVSKANRVGRREVLIGNGDYAA
jgi:DNA segregation ATPase FtsK/SpoIIIE, S-DNA-T family